MALAQDSSCRINFMGKKLHSKVREPTRQRFISLGGVVGLLLGGEEDFEDGDFEGEDQEGLDLADSIWADNSQIRINDRCHNCGQLGRLARQCMARKVNANFIPRSGRGPGKLADVQLLQLW